MPAEPFQQCFCFIIDQSCYLYQGMNSYHAYMFFHLLQMELYVHPLRWMPRLPFILIVTAYCASLLPCSVCFDAQYEICRRTSTCGDINIYYPFGVGKRGCGLSTFQIDCVQNSTPVIAIHGLNYTVVSFHYDKFYFLIFRDENCQFLEDHFDIWPEYGDTVFRFVGKFKRTIDVYNCKTPISHVTSGGADLRKCNATAYYAVYDNGQTIQECSMEQVTVDVGITGWVSNDTKRNENCISCEASGGICGYNISDSTATAPFVCYCKNGPHTDRCTHGVHIGAAVGGSVGAAVLIAGLLVGIIVYRRRNSLCIGEILVVNSVRGDEDKDLEAGIQGKMGTLPFFSYEILKQATNEFDEKNHLGNGGFGSVYLGKLRDGRDVAVKRLYQDNCKRVLEQFINEVHILSVSYHPNLVRLYGCTSPQSRDLLLVYEYVPNGTLEDHLHGERKKEKGLNWDTRLKICIETAQALAFLHCLEQPIFHRDVKSPNILLDEDLHVKVADFGLSRFVPLDVTHVSTAPQGTPGYVDPEYLHCFQLTDKSDVYSFGVVLMEIISGMLVVDINRIKGEIVLADMAIAKIQAGALHDLIDPNLDIHSNPDIKVMVTAVAKLAFRCLAPVKEDRPDMKEVVAELEQIKQNGRKCKHPVFNPMSPISVQEKWPSTSTTPENSPS